VFGSQDHLEMREQLAWEQCDDVHVSGISTEKPVMTQNRGIVS
jgi:hypothetical protein